MSITDRLTEIEARAKAATEGPEPGTWWLQAHDDEAFGVVDQLGEKQNRGEPVVKGVWKNCIAVRSNEIKPGTL